MSTKASNRVGFSPDVNEKPPIFLNGARACRNRKRVNGIFGFKLPKSSRLTSPTRLLRRLSTKVVRALRLVSATRRSSRKVSSAPLARSRSVADPILDSHRAEAIEDCIEFLNSSSSLSRSNSVSANSCC